MTDCSTETLLFPEDFSKPVHVSFRDEHLSSNGGLVLLSARDRQLGLTEELAGVLKDKREQSKIDHKLVEELRSRVMGIALGHADCNDAAKLRMDPMMKLACDRDPINGEDLASQPTLCRFENSATGKSLYSMATAIAEKVISEQSRKRQEKRPRKIIIDIDPTCDPTYGGQQLTLFSGYYATWCYLPTVVTVSFGGERRKYPVAAVLRPGTAHEMVGTIGIISRLVGLLRKYFGSTRLYLRADSKFASPEFFRFMERKQMRYAIAMSSNNVLKKHSAKAMAHARDLATKKNQTATLYGWDFYRSGGWNRDRQIAYKAQVLVHKDKDDHRDNDRYVVHNLDSRHSPEGAMRFYYGHSDIENSIKELKNDLHMDRTSCQKFAANQFRLLMTLAAYVLMQSVQEHAIDANIASAQMGILRERLLKIAVKIKSSVRRITMEFTSHHPWSQEWTRCALAIGAVPT